MVTVEGERRNLVALGRSEFGNLRIVGFGVQFEWDLGIEGK